MKIKPDLLLLNNQKNLYKKILVSGSDEPLISYITEKIVKNYKDNQYHVDASGEINRGLTGDLFSDKKILFLLKDSALIKKINWDEPLGDHSILIACSNNAKINALKSKFTKPKDSLLVDCYPLTRPAKELVLKDFVKRESLNISGDVFWYIVDNFENELVLFKNQLKSLSLFNKEIKLVDDVEKVVQTEHKAEINKIFFYIFQKNSYLISLFEKNIYSQGDFYFFLNSLKLYIGIISASINKEQALSKFPRYLFNEKDSFIKIYDKLNKKKILKIYQNIQKVEELVRKNSEIYQPIGLRFFLNTKKIIVS